MVSISFRLTADLTDKSHVDRGFKPPESQPI
jgi:hypothetical protein